MKLAKMAVLAALGTFAFGAAQAAPMVAPAKTSTDSIVVQAQAKKKVAKKKVAKKAVKKKRVAKVRKARKVRVAKVRVKAAKSCGTYMYRKGKKCMDARAKK